MSEQTKSDSDAFQAEPLRQDGSSSLVEQSIAARDKNIEDELEEAEISLPPEERKRVRMVVEQIIEKSQFFSGPQPSPELLAKYEEVCPGSADKLLQMGFDEQRHRHAWEIRALDQKDRIIDLDHRDATYAMTGLILGFFALLVILGVGVYALATGHMEVAIGCLGGGFLAAVVSVFVNGKTRKTPTTDDTATEANSAPKTQ
jgi:uncharacterized membrane protein